MFERFTVRARRVVVLSQEEARVRNHDHIGTRHLLLPLVDENIYSGPASEDREAGHHSLAILRALGVSCAGMRADIDAVTVNGSETPTGRIPFTDEAKKVLELSLREALQLGHTYISTAHLLIAVLRQGDEAHWFMSHGVEIEQLRAEAVKGPHNLFQSGSQVALVSPPPVPRAASAPLPVEPVLGAPAREAQRLAHEESIAFGHNYVGTEHLLLALLAVDDPAGLSPADLLPPKVTARVVRDDVIRISGKMLGGGSRPVPTFEVEESYRIAEQLARSSAEPLIRPLHMFAAVTRMDGSVARVVVRNSGILNTAIEILDRPDAAELEISADDRLTMAVLTGRRSTPVISLPGPDDDDGPPDGRSHFERYTDQARRVIVLSQEEARTLNHQVIDTEHVLLGIVQEGDSLAADVLHAMGISLHEIRRQVEDIVVPGDGVSPGHIPFTQGTRTALQLSQREAAQMRHNHIGPEHLLIGLVREEEGKAARVLRGVGANLTLIQQLLLERRPGEMPPQVSAPESGPSIRAWATAHARTLAPSSQRVDGA